MQMQPWYKCPNQLHSKRSGVLKESYSFYSTPFLHVLTGPPLGPAKGKRWKLDYKFSNSINCSLISKSGMYMMLPFS